ncbi:hypothetical protein HK102_012645 [Quaeritorhiza haematococci]|nr:hypothetical protein HK102_012645 [Quaeritorhiza haematococci]
MKFQSQSALWATVSVAVLCIRQTSARPTQQIPLQLDSAIDTFFGVKVLRANADGSCTFLEAGPAQQHRLLSAEIGAPKVIVNKYPAVVDHHHHDEEGTHGENEEALQIVDIVGLTEAHAWNALDENCPAGITASEDQTPGYTNPVASDERSAGVEETEEAEALKDEVVKIIDSGPPENRIDVVFMGDGYTLAERDRFFEDIRRLTNDMWTSTTFASPRPLFNIWAVYRPSVSHGIGVGGRAKDTAFGLYRDGTELRGVYCSKPAAAREACRSTGQYACDFPSLIGNDDYYGGLGGEFTISTRSPTSGTVVLRHELGHNFIQVGEEYDGGFAYFGYNTASSLSSLPWKHWLSEPENIREERSKIQISAYPWHDLAKGGRTFRFKSDGSYQRWYLRMTASGVEIDGALEVFLDGKPLPWKTTGNLDRAFFDWGDEATGLTAGEHVLEIRQGIPANATAPIRQLCSLTLHEYDAEPKYLCKEGMWLEFLKRVSFIDAINVTCNKQTQKASITLDLIPLAHLRPENERVDGEVYHITWLHKGVEKPEFSGKTEIEVDVGAGAGSGQWQVVVRFETREVRKDNGLMTSRKGFSVPSQC